MWPRHRRVGRVRKKKKKKFFFSSAMKQYRPAGLGRWPLVGFGQVNPFPLFFSSFSFLFSCFTDLDSNLNSNLFCRILNLGNLLK
jgi:hypothetical protein